MEMAGGIFYPLGQAGLPVAMSHSQIQALHILGVSKDERCDGGVV